MPGFRALAFAAASVLLGFAAPVVAQQRLADTLIERAKGAMIDNPPEALALAEQAEQRAARIPDPHARATAAATALWLQGEALIRSREALAAAPKVTRALRLIRAVREPTKLRGDLLLARSGIQQAQTRPAEALASLQEAFKIFGDVGEKRSQSITLQTIATLYTQANDFASADKYFKQASEVYEGDPRLSLFLHNNRGNVLLRLERPSEAVVQYRRALAVARSLDSDTLLPPILINLARSLIHDNKYAEADRVIAEARRLIARGASPKSMLFLDAIAAELAYEVRQFDLAKRLIERAFAGVELKDTPLALRDAHLTAYNIYSARGESAKALVHLERVRKLGDDAAQLATSTNIALMAARFDFANQELQIANLKAEELRQAAEFQRTLFIGLGTATLVIIGLLSFGIFTLRRSRNQVRAANTELNQTNTALQKALKAKTEFLATTSHEIRTPLNGILGMTQIMLRDPKVSAETRDRLGIVHGAGMTMRALVDDILDVAKMETGNLTVELAVTDLHAMLKDVSRMWDEQARGKGVGFILDTQSAPRWIETDPGRLRQMLFNLLSNAVKFTERGEIAVRASQCGDRLHLAISDTGIGIPAEKHEEIFESFRQVDAGTTRKFGGTGLGLAIVRNLARALDGDVTVASVEGQGTTFTVDMQLRLADAPPMAETTDSGGETIIVLDRNPIARGMLRTLFAPHFAAVEFASTPAEAIDLIAVDIPVLLVADEATLKASGDDPVSILGELVAAAHARHARTAVLWARPDDAVRALLSGTNVDTLVEKPVSGATLIEKLTADTQQKHRKTGVAALVSNAA